MLWAGQGGQRHACRQPGTQRPLAEMPVVAALPCWKQPVHLCLCLPAHLAAAAPPLSAVCPAGMPCHVDLQANRMLPHAASSSRATNLFHFLKVSQRWRALLAAGCWLLSGAVACCALLPYYCATILTPALLSSTQQQ